MSTHGDQNHVILNSIQVIQGILRHYKKTITDQDYVHINKRLGAIEKSYKEVCDFMDLFEELVRKWKDESS